MKDIVGLAVLAWPLTLLVLIGITFLIAVSMVVRYAGKHGRSKWRWGIGAFLIVYLPIFWDWIPTVAVHQYYCAKDSGFWVYKTLDQWKAENPGVMERLVSYNKNPGGFNVDWPSQHELRDGGHQKININHINEHFDVIVNWQDVFEVLPVVRTENLLIDRKKNQVLARYVDFSTGNSVIKSVGPLGSLKFWLHSGSCIGGRDEQAKFGNFYLQFEGSEK